MDYRHITCENYSGGYVYKNLCTNSYFSKIQSMNTDDIIICRTEKSKIKNTDNIENLEKLSLTTDEFEFNYKTSIARIFDEIEKYVLTSDIKSISREIFDMNTTEKSESVLKMKFTRFQKIKRKILSRGNYVFNWIELYYFRCLSTKLYGRNLIRIHGYDLNESLKIERERINTLYPSNRYTSIYEITYESTYITKYKCTPEYR